MPSLPPEYVPVLRQNLRRVVKRMHADYSAEIEAAYARGLSEGRDEVVVGLKALAKLNGSGAAVMGMTRVVKAAAHAPAGGVTVQGKEYRGGEFIPGEVMEQATAEEKDAVHNPKGKDKKTPTAQDIEAVIHAKAAELLPDANPGKGRTNINEIRAGVKEKLGDVPREIVDKVLLDMDANGTLRLVPLDGISDEDHKRSKDGIRDNYGHVQFHVKRGAKWADPAKQPDSQTKPASSPAIRTVERTRKLLASDKPLSQVIAAVQQQLEGHTHAELAEIKAHLGIKAGGAKAEMARKIAERAASVDKTNRRHYTHTAMSVDQVHDLIQGHKDAGTLDTADGIRSVVQAIGTGLTVKQVAELKQRLGVKAGGAKHEMATRIALRAAQGERPNHMPDAGKMVAISADDEAAVKDAFGGKLNPNMHPEVQKRFIDAANKRNVLQRQMDELETKKAKLSPSSEEWRNTVSEIADLSAKHRAAGVIDKRIDKPATVAQEPDVGQTVVVTKPDGSVETVANYRSPQDTANDKILAKLNGTEPVKKLSPAKQKEQQAKERMKQLTSLPRGELEALADKHGIDHKTYPSTHNLAYALRDLPTPSPTAANGAKQPHEMTREEYLPTHKFGGLNPTTVQRQREVYQNTLANQPHNAETMKASLDRSEARAGSNHKTMVELALAQGKPVPPEVLADYPDLAAKYAPAKPQATPAAKPTINTIQDIGQHHASLDKMTTKELADTIKRLGYGVEGKSKPDHIAQLKKHYQASRDMTMRPLMGSKDTEAVEQAGKHWPALPSSPQATPTGPTDTIRGFTRTTQSNPPTREQLAVAPKTQAELSPMTVPQLVAELGKLDQQPISKSKASLIEQIVRYHANRKDMNERLDMSN